MSRREHNGTQYLACKKKETGGGGARGWERLVESNKELYLIFIFLRAGVVTRNIWNYVDV